MITAGTSPKRHRMGRWEVQRDAGRQGQKLHVGEIGLVEIDEVDALRRSGVTPGRLIVPSSNIHTAVFQRDGGRHAGLAEPQYRRGRTAGEEAEIEGLRPVLG